MRDSRLVLGPTMQGYMGLGAVLGGSQKGLKEHVWSNQKPLFGRGLAPDSAPETLPVKFNLLICYIRRSTMH